MSKKPWMPLYIADYLKDTTHLGAIESGAYLHLIMDYWQNGKLPTDDRQLARIAKLTDREWKKLKPTLQAFFHDGWQHKRIDAEIVEANKLAESNAEKARDAANKRWSKHKPSNPEAMLQACPEHAPSNATNDAPECTLHTSQRKIEEAPDGAPPKYAFESGVIRLNQKDFSLWKATFTHIDVGAELIGMTEWASQQRSWFNAVKGALAKKNREVKERKDQLKEQGGFKWNGIEGVI